jgi:hypothetical protein
MTDLVRIWAGLKFIKKQKPTNKFFAYTIFEKLEPEVF